MCRVIGLVAMLACTMTCGCKLLWRPSDELRHGSYVPYQKLFTGSHEFAKRQTYIILSGPAQFRATMDSQNETVDWSGGEKGFSSGLAVGYDSEGYLITSAHALHTTNFVLGWFDGRMDVKPARVVFRRDSNTHADFALVKINGRLDYCAHLGDKPKIGDRIFAVVGYRNKTGVMIAFASGKVLSVEADPVGGPLDLIRTDVPLWFGDSGGPLLSSNGRVIGINSGVRFTWNQHWSDSFYTDSQFIQYLIAEDRGLKAPRRKEIDSP